VVSRQESSSAISRRRFLRAVQLRCCTAGMAVGLYGRAGTDLDYLALECSTLS
jgi:hypothetical protein